MESNGWHRLERRFCKSNCQRKEGPPKSCYILWIPCLLVAKTDSPGLNLKVRIKECATK
jgi:hypothetical protein